MKSHKKEVSFHLFHLINHSTWTFPVKLEQFTDCFHIAFQKDYQARKAKKFLDATEFYGGILHISYAPERETIDDTRHKLESRKRDVRYRMQQLVSSKRDEKQVDTLPPPAKRFKSDHMSTSNGSLNAWISVVCEMLIKDDVSHVFWWIFFGYRKNFCFRFGAHFVETSFVVQIAEFYTNKRSTHWTWKTSKIVAISVTGRNFRSMRRRRRN